MRNAGALTAFLGILFLLPPHSPAQEADAVSDAKCWGALVYAHDDPATAVSADEVVDQHGHVARALP